MEEVSFGLGAAYLMRGFETSVNGMLAGRGRSARIPRSNSVKLRFYGGGVYNGCIYNKIHGFASFRCLRMIDCFGLNFA
jgi:hypothetical protein